MLSVKVAVQYCRGGALCVGGGGGGGEAYSVHTNDTMLSVCALVPCSPSSRGVFSVAAEQDVGAVNGLAVFSAELALALPNIVSHCLQTGL